MRWASDTMRKLRVLVAIRLVYLILGEPGSSFKIHPVNESTLEVRTVENGAFKIARVDENRLPQIRSFEVSFA